MFLKSIEIQGFKSFAHKTVLNFNSGMTAIVGPNGSGKSNIADAVRWVLGEQKVKQLRGASMQDVIFAGTELRKPLGFAFVSMTFDNSDRSLNLDFTEVTVSRRLYRSGESEYMINGQAVRLKDVQELFFDTGIGKEGYSIIGQGQIEAIVSGRPEDRRGLFDEACGIVKFKKRKQAAVRKLEEEEVNLNRVSDILNELEKQIGPLARQSESAREYLKLHDTLRKYDLTIFSLEAQDLLDELDANDKSLSIAREQADEVKEESERLKNLNTDLSDQIALAERELSEGEQELQKGQLLLGNLDSQINVAKAEIGAEQGNLSRLSEDLERLNREAGSKEEVLKEYYRSAKALKQDIELIQGEKEISGLSVDTDPKALVRMLSEGMESIRELLPEDALREMESQTEAESDPASAKTQDNNAGAGQTPDDEDDDDLFAFAEPEWLKAIRHKKNDLALVNEKAQQLKGWIDTAEQQYQKLALQYKQLENKRNDLIQQRASVSSRLEALKNIAERYEGYGQAVQSVMALKNRQQGIHGVIADLIHTDSRYETAIETALGSRIQNIVTDTETTAKELIRYLKNNRLGRATFLPMDAVRGRSQEEYKRAASEPGCLGIASEVVHFDREYRDVMESLLGNTLVFQTIDQALAAAGKYHHALRMVTLDGELLSPGGALSGGAYKNSSNLIGRTRELKELEDRLDQAMQKYRDNDTAMTELRSEMEEAGQEADRLREELSSVNEEKNSLSFGLSGELKLKISNLNQSASFMTENIDRVTREAEKEKEDRRKFESLIQAGTEKIREKEKEIALRREDITHVQNGISELTEKIQTARSAKEELGRSQSAYFRRRDEINEESLHLEKELLRLDNIREKLSGRLDSQTQRIWDAYEVSLSQAKKEADDTLGTLPVMKSEAGSLQSKIKALGPINLTAIEEYQKVSERYELMHTQHEDIVRSRGEIVKIIDELDEGMKKQFNEQFSAIRTEFQRVFRELFGGGNADLELSYDADSVEPQDELSAGIAIHAQPPGKKLQNMMQLSGGEKAFTAIALLFAIQNLKPSPFCLLDEIEAALDDSNVLRFAQYIKRISSRSQFILITHRRGTMENADRLYGITMQEKGVTSLVSVDLVSDSVS